MQPTALDEAIVAGLYPQLVQEIYLSNKMSSSLIEEVKLMGGL